MPDFRVFTGNEPAGTIVVRLVATPDGPRAFIRAVAAPSDVAEEAIEQSEQVAVQEALALARNKQSNIDGGAQIVVELGPDTAWDTRWGSLT